MSPFQKKIAEYSRKLLIFQTDFLLKFWDCSGAKVCKSCRACKMLSNAYFLAKFRFDTAENEPTKNLQNFRKMHFRKMHFRKTAWSPRPHGTGPAATSAPWTWASRGSCSPCSRSGTPASPPPATLARTSGSPPEVMNFCWMIWFLGKCSEMSAVVCGNSARSTANFSKGRWISGIHSFLCKISEKTGFLAKF